MMITQRTTVCHLSLQYYADAVLNADVILAAQAFGLTEGGQKVVIATDPIMLERNRLLAVR